MMRHTQQKFHTFESHYWLKQCVDSVTYVVCNMANDAFDQKFGNRNKNHFKNATIEKFIWRLVV